MLNDERVSQIIKAIQYIIDCNSDDNSSTNKLSESIDPISHGIVSERKFNKEVDKLKGEIRNI